MVCRFLLLTANFTDGTVEQLYRPNLFCNESFLALAARGRTEHVLGRSYPWQKLPPALDCHHVTSAVCRVLLNRTFHLVGTRQNVPLLESAVFWNSVSASSCRTSRSSVSACNDSLLTRKPWPSIPINFICATVSFFWTQWLYSAGKRSTKASSEAQAYQKDVCAPLPMFTVVIAW